MVLRAVIVEGHEQGSGPKKGYSPMSKNQAHHSGDSHRLTRFNHTVVKLDFITATAISDSNKTSDRGRGCGKL